MYGRLYSPVFAQVAFDVSRQFVTVRAQVGLENGRGRERVAELSALLADPCNGIRLAGKLRAKFHAFEGRVLPEERHTAHKREDEVICEIDIARSERISVEMLTCHMLDKRQQRRKCTFYSGVLFGESHQIQDEGEFKITSSFGHFDLLSVNLSRFVTHLGEVTLVLL